MIHPLQVRFFDVCLGGQQAPLPTYSCLDDTGGWTWVTGLLALESGTGRRAASAAAPQPPRRA